MGIQKRSGAGNALGWAAAVTSLEYAARRMVPSRARAWIVSYSVLGWASLRESPRKGRTEAGKGSKFEGGAMAGLLLVVFGYPLGRILLRDRPDGAPGESFWLETAALGGVVAPAEELIWGGKIEPVLGIAPAAGLFALKHVVVDGRWKRAFGLFLFAEGLGLLRRRSPGGAAAAHILANAAGVAKGHLTSTDQF